MKKALTVLLVAMAVCLVSGSAWAIPVSDTEYMVAYLNGSDQWGSNNSYSYSFNIIGHDGYTLGDQINSGSIDFTISDNESGDDSSAEGHWVHHHSWFWSWDEWVSGYDNNEYVQLTTDGITQSFEIDNGYGASLNLTALSRLETDGRLNVTLTCTSGDFWLLGSTLNADYTDRTANSPVPEPATLMLLGSGLLGLAGFRRKQK